MVMGRPAPPEVLPVLRWWIERLRAQLEERGEKAELVRALKRAGTDCSTGQLNDLIKLDKNGEPVSKYSRLVAPIDKHYKWPALMPTSEAANEIRDLIDSLDTNAVTLLNALRDLPPDELQIQLALILSRKKTVK